MLRAVNASNGPVSAAPNPVREAQGASSPLSAGGQPNPVAAVETTSAAPGAAANVLAYRYNSSEFVYRQDIGRIVLVGQSPETGERTIQIPSEEALRAYERTIRAEERRTLMTPEQLLPEGKTPAHVPAPAAVTPAPRPVALPNLQQALGAVFGANQSSAVVSVSA